MGSPLPPTPPPYHALRFLTSPPSFGAPGRWQDRAFQAKDNQRYKPKHTVPAGEPNRQHEARGHVHKGDPAPGYVPKECAPGSPKP